MEDTATVQVDGNKIILKDLFGKAAKVEAKIYQIDLVAHKVILMNFWRNTG